MARSYNLTVNGNELDIVIKSGKLIVNLNGAPYHTFKLGLESQLISVKEDYPITIGENNYIIALRGKSLRIAYNGKYLDNNEEFIPKVELPAWTWVFIALNLVIPIISLGGVINFLLGFLGIIICAAVCRSAKIPTAVKVILSIVTTIAMWVAWVVLNLLIYSMM